MDSFLFPQIPGGSLPTASIPSHDHYTTIPPDWAIQIASQGSTGTELPIANFLTPAYLDEMSKRSFDRAIDEVDTNETDMNTIQMLGMRLLDVYTVRVGDLRYAL